MPPQFKIAVILGSALIGGVAVAMLVNPPADAALMEKIPYWAIGFLIGAVPTAGVVAWVLNKLGL